MDKRRAEERLFVFLMKASVAVVGGSLLSILVVIFARGAGGVYSLLHGNGYGGEAAAGIRNAVAGSLLVGGGATLLALACSIPLVFFLNVYLKRRSPVALFIRLSLDMLWGVPSIVYGAFGFIIMVSLGMKASLLGGIVAIALLIMPVMARNMDEVVRTIPFELMEASYAVGATRWETSLMLMFRQALPGLLTAMLIAFGRGIGDAAAVLFTAGYTDVMPHSLADPVATLPLAIFFQLGSPFPEIQHQGYASALILMMMILAISCLSRWVSGTLSRPRSGKPSKEQ